MRRITATLSILLMLAGCSQREQIKPQSETEVSPTPIAQHPAGDESKDLISVAPMKMAMEGRAHLQPTAAPTLRPEQLVEREYNTEEYGRFDEQPFLRAADHPLSTFSIDVDTASYSNIRRFIRSGQLPPRQAVRIEEMVNYFSYSYPEPRGADPFSVTTELAECPWNGEHRLLHVGLQARRVDLKDMPPNNLVFLLDVSGSMEAPNKLPLVQSALELLVDNLREQDRVAIVVYAGAAGMVLPSTSGSDKAAIREAIRNLSAGGSTAGGEGILLAYKTAQDNLLPRGNNRIILATDGDFNVGVSSDGELERLITEKRSNGIFLTVLGFGTGNVKDSKMELLADEGNGNYAYIDDLNEARKVLVTEMGGTLLTVAKDVKIQIEFNPARVAAYRLIGYENRALRNEDFNDDRKDAGEIGAGHSVTALYEIVPPGAATKVGNVDPLKYQTKPAVTGGAGELATLKIRYKQPDGETSSKLERTVAEQPRALDRTTDDFRFAAAVAELGLLLRDSEFKGHASYDDVLRLARASTGQDDDRAAFLEMARRARDIAPARKD